MTFDRDERPVSRARSGKMSASQPSPAAPTAAPAESAPPPSFEDGLAQLGELVERLEGGSLGLSASISAYEQGVTLLRRLHAELETAEQKVNLLTGVAGDGTAALEPWPPTGSEARSQPGKPGPEGTPGRTRTNRPKRLPGMDEASGAV